VSTRSFTKTGKQHVNKEHFRDSLHQKLPIGPCLWKLCEYVTGSSLYEIKYTMLYGPSAKVSLLYQMAEQETTCGGAKVGRLTYDHVIVSSSKVK